MNAFGEQLSALRKERSISQAAIADQVGVSQATISRLESLSMPPSDTRLIAKLSRSLGVRVSELLSESSLQDLWGEAPDESFVAFCPNPFCKRNVHYVDADDGSLTVRWDSSERYLASQYDEFNFCGECGEDLVKECPSCRRRMDTDRLRFCVTCGSRICERPTDAEWVRLKEIHEIDRSKNATPPRKMIPTACFSRASPCPTQPQRSACSSISISR